MQRCCGLRELQCVVGEFSLSEVSLCHCFVAARQHSQCLLSLLLPQNSTSKLRPFLKHTKNQLIILKHTTVFYLCEGILHARDACQIMSVSVALANTLRISRCCSIFTIFVSTEIWHGLLVLTKPRR